MTFPAFASRVRIGAPIISTSHRPFGTCANQDGFMNVGSRQEQTSHRPDPTDQDPAVKAAGAWINQFARTLKTCRLYDAINPTVGKFRQDLAIGLQRLIDEYGPMAFKFT